MMYKVDKESLARSIRHSGSFIKHVVCMEELAELQQAVSKFIRGKGDRDNLIEEIADVIICIENIKILHFISDTEINEQISYKIDRQIQREREGE